MAASAKLVPASAVAAPAVAYASHREFEIVAIWRRDERIFIFITSQLCERTPIIRGFPCGKRVRWLGWSRLTDLPRAPEFQVRRKVSRTKFPAILSGPPSTNSDNWSRLRRLLVVRFVTG